MKQPLIHSGLLPSLSAALAVLLPALTSEAGGYYGKFYPKGPSIDIHSTPKEDFWSTTYINSLGDSWTHPTWAYCYPILDHGRSDIIGLTAVSNRNLIVAFTPQSRLSDFMSGRRYSQYRQLNIGFNQSRRYYGSMFTSISGNNLRQGTYGLGVRASRWNNHSSSDALTGYEVEMKYLHAYQPGQNPSRYSGRYSSYAWVRSRVMSYALSEPPLNLGKARTRQWKLGSFTPVTDRRGNGPYRYYLTGNSSLSASNPSGVYIIPSSQERSFLSGGSFQYYYKGSGWMREELRLPLGRRYSVVVKDFTNGGTASGAQVRLHITRYR